MKYCVIIPDGMADYGIAKLQGKTAMEAARTPNMDRVSMLGELGLCQTVPRGYTPGSDVAIMSVLGYSPKAYYTGRAPLEAASMDIELGPNDWAVRCNLVTAGTETLEDFTAGHITTDEARVVIAALNKVLGSGKIEFFPGVSYRHILVLRDIPPLKLKTTPPHDIQGQQMAKYLPRGDGADVLIDLMQRSVEVLKDLTVNTVRVDLRQNPASMIWLWGEGQRPRLDAFRERFGVEGGVISAVDLVKGLATLMGMEVIEVPGATGYVDTDYAAKARYAVDALQRLDLVVIHIEAPDEAGHEANITDKVRAIESIDKDIVGPVLAEAERVEEMRVLVMPDHFTPIAERTHTREPVPFAIWGAGVAGESALAFTEQNAAKTGLRIKRGHELMTRFIKGTA